MPLSLWLFNLIFKEIMSDYYEILDVPKTATDQDIKKA